MDADAQLLNQKLQAWRSKDPATRHPIAAAVGFVYEDDDALEQLPWIFLRKELMVIESRVDWIGVPRATADLPPGSQGVDRFVYLKGVKMSEAGVAQGRLGLAAAFQAQVQPLLSHVNVLRCLRVFSIPSQDYVFLVLPMRPVSLRALVVEMKRQSEGGVTHEQRHKCVKLAVVGRLVQGMARGLDYLHTTLGISHGDLRLEHVLVPSLQEDHLTRDHPKLCDFSCSRLTRGVNGRPIYHKRVLEKTLIANEAPGECLYWS